MSAIAGIYHANKEPVSIEHISGVMDALQKYPCNDIQVWYKENIFFGCHAQWITSESIGEKQPYYDYERQLAITADAIIDNRDELFEKLQVAREQRKGMSDSQLILLAYQKWQEETPKYLIGDFAFVIWDERKQKLFAARDFSGARTLYFHYNNGRFAFCTAIQPLLTLPYIRKNLNEQWLAEYLAVPNMLDGVDASLTPFDGVEQILPSHFISICNGKINIARYCTLVVNEKLNYKKDQDYVEAFQDVFQNAVDARLRTPYAVGAQLSGGLDSGAVVSFAAKTLRKENKHLHTFSYIPEKDFTDWTPKYRVADERPFINSTVQYLGNIEENYLDFKGKSPLSEIDDWLEIMETPYKFFENSVWVKGIHEKASQKGIRVLLSGARGNFTISWGPALDYYSSLLKKMNWIRLYRELHSYSLNIGVTNKSRILSLIGRKAFPFMNRLQESYQLPMLINPDFAKRKNVFETLYAHGIDIKASSQLNIYQVRKEHFEKVFIWNTTGISGTKLSLRYSAWNRDPTNDIRVIRFCLSLPEEQFVQNGLDRALVRRSTKNFLPDKVRLNQKVRGIQGADWIHRMAPSWNSFLEELQQLSKDSIVSEFFNMQVIKTAISKIEGGPKTQYAFDPDFRILMRSLIVYRFLKNLT
ncbi:lasso peptide isopeptide bond-forming cyclase [Priestia megaterium]|uniref:lasso peptide isopeptide bond-forming cyclase n=1 Tax=Priestia megaterium TaxID=1404 RepID=UPI0021AC0F74|nr:lasso peptide isopeptide bond-forming cyclase [Priestia megaterium]MCR8925000.1 lasso peptide isopeptide bond-forming cyclase [Priestia megaterium]